MRQGDKDLPVDLRGLEGTALDRDDATDLVVAAEGRALVATVFDIRLPGLPGGREPAGLGDGWLGGGLVVEEWAGGQMGRVGMVVGVPLPLVGFHGPIVRQSGDFELPRRHPVLRRFGYFQFHRVGQFYRTISKLASALLRGERDRHAVDGELFPVPVDDFELVGRRVFRFVMATRFTKFIGTRRKYILCKFLFLLAVHIFSVQNDKTVC